MIANPFFTVVIPTYNRSHLILPTLETVFNQTYRNFEIIVVDNCSTDNTVAVLQPFIEANKLILIQHDKNYERSKSRNTGMIHAKGDYVTFLDSDDFMYQNNLQDAANFVQNNPSIKIFQNLYELVDKEGKRIYSYTFPKLDNQYKALCNGNFMSCIGGFIHKEIYQNFRFDTDPRLIGSEDYEYWFRIFAKYKVGRIEKVNSGIVEHPARSVNQKIYDNLLFQKDYILNKLRADQQVYEVYKPYLKRLEASFYLQGAVVANGDSDFTKSLKFLYQAFKTDPSVLATKRFISISRITLLKKII